MTKSAPPRSSRERVRVYRQRLRAKGLKPVTFWLPDPHAASFLAQANAEAKAVSSAPDDAEVMDFIADLQDWPADEDVFWREPPEGAGG